MAMTAQVKAELASTASDQVVLPQGRGLVDAAFRRRTAHRLRPDRRRGRARHRRGGAPAAPRHRRGLRLPQRDRRASAAAACAGARHYVVRVVKDGEALARQTGLLDLRGRPVRGLPPQVVSGATCDAVAAWRGRVPRARLAHRARPLVRRSRSPAPAPRRRSRSVGAARRLGITAKAREVRGVDRVVIRDGDAIAALLTRLGAHESVLAWEERRMRREVRATANRLANFDDANLRRSARAAVAAGARVERALEILGDDVPDHLRQRRPAARSSTGRRAWRSSAQLHRPAADQGRDRRPHPPAAGDGRQARRGHSASPTPRPA